MIRLAGEYRSLNKPVTLSDRANHYGRIIAVFLVGVTSLGGGSYKPWWCRGWIPPVSIGSIVTKEGYDLKVVCTSKS